MSEHRESCPCCKVTIAVIEYVEADSKGTPLQHLNGVLEAAAIIAANSVKEGKQEASRDWLLRNLGERFDDAVIRVAEAEMKGVAVQ